MTHDTLSRSELSTVILTNYFVS